MYTINPGAFNKSIELLEYKSKVNDDNIPVLEWETILRCKARIRNNTSTSAEMDNGDNFISKKTVTIRYPKHLTSFDTEDNNRYKIKYNNRLYEISSMSNVREENKYLQVVVKVAE